MNKEIIFAIEEDIEGGFVAKSISDNIFVQGETMQELRANIKEAVLCHFEEEEM